MGKGIIPLSPKRNSRNGNNNNKKILPSTPQDDFSLILVSMTAEAGESASQTAWVPTLPLTCRLTFGSWWLFSHL